MDKSEELFEGVKRQMLSQNTGVNEGTMMSSPGIQYKGKNFAFLYRGGMCFRVGRDFEPESEGIHQYELLNPFKNKPPLKDWFVIGVEYGEKWPELAQVALQNISK